MKHLLQFLVLLVLSYVPFFAFAETGELNSADESMSIKELHENIKDLKLAKQNLSAKWNTFASENGGMSDFIKDDLSEIDIANIEELLSEYFSQKESIDAQLGQTSETEAQSTLKNKAIQLKLDLYKSLTTYIKTEKLKDYLAYIKSNLEIIKEDTEIKNDISRKEEILDRKVEAIKEKIETNNRLLDEKIRSIVSLKIEEKIQLLQNHPKFIPLSTDQKKAVFEATLKKISEKKQTLKNIYDKTTIVEKKIEIYEIIEEKLKTIISQY